MGFSAKKDYVHGTPQRLGILLANLGTPDAADTRSVRRYLAEFLWDPRVVEVFRPIWWLILHLVILRVRPSRSAHAYEKVWTPEGSPLLVWTRRQAAALAGQLGERLGAPPRIEVGTIGLGARAVGAASGPISSQFLLDMNSGLAAS